MSREKYHFGWFMDLFEIVHDDFELSTFVNL